MLAPPYILLVEDNPDDIELTLISFKHSHIASKIEVLRDGAAAVDFLLAQGDYANRGQGLPQVVLLDINLPKMNGIEVLKTLRADERTRTLPVVMLTTSNEEQDVLDSYSFGANSYVRKPVSFDEFAKAIEMLWT